MSKLLGYSEGPLELYQYDSSIIIFRVYNTASLITLGAPVHIGVSNNIFSALRLEAEWVEKSKLDELTLKFMEKLKKENYLKKEDILNGGAFKGYTYASNINFKNQLFTIVTKTQLPKPSSGDKISKLDLGNYILLEHVHKTAYLVNGLEGHLWPMFNYEYNTSLLKENNSFELLELPEDIRNSISSMIEIAASGWASPSYLTLYDLPPIVKENLYIEKTENVEKSDNPTSFF